MDSKQISAAMRNKTPVLYNGQQYARILEYVMWYDKKGQRQLSVVLQGDQNYTVRVPADKIQEA